MFPPKISPNLERAGHRFFFAEDLLSPEETHHLLKVMRKKVGDHILLIDGKGHEYLGRVVSLESSGKRPRARIELIKLLRKELPPSVKTYALIPLLKGDLTEFLVEKGTELGVQAFLPFISKYTIPLSKENLMERLNKKVLSALKQSGRLTTPLILPPQPLTKLLQDLSKEGLKILADQKGELTIFDLKELLAKKKFEKVYLLSGPEGGFSPEEREAILQAGFQAMCLGPHILRAETASLSLMSIIQALLQQSFSLSSLEFLRKE